MEAVCSMFNQRVQELAQQDLDITAAVDALNELWEDEFQYHGKDINFGDCEWFADELCAIVPGAEAFWGDELTIEGEDQDYFAYHCFVRYQERYYDSECSEGVDDWRKLSSFIEQRKGW